MQIIKLLNEIKSGNLTYTSLSNKNKVRVMSIMEAKSKGITKSEMKKWIKTNIGGDIKSSDIVFNEDGCEILKGCSLMNIPPFKIKFTKWVYIEIENIENLDWMDIIDIKDITTLGIEKCNNLSDMTYLNNTEIKELSLINLPNLTELNIQTLNLEEININNVGINDLTGIPEKISKLCTIMNCKTLTSLKGMKYMECNELYISSCINLTNLKFYSPSIKRLDNMRGLPLKSLKGLIINPSDIIVETMRNFIIAFPNLKWSDIKFNITKEDIKDYLWDFGGVVYYYICYLINDITDDEIYRWKRLIAEDVNNGKEFIDMIKDDVPNLM